MVSKLVFSLVIAVSLQCSSAKSLLGSEVPVCDAKASNLNACIKSSANKLIPRLNKGVRELDLPPIDPMHIPRMDIGQENGAVYLKLELMNTVHTGLTKVNTEAAEIDMKNMVWSLKFFIPKYTLTGDYIGKGRILLLPLGGAGFANFTFHDMRMGLVLSGSRKKVNGDEFFDLQKAKVTVTFSPGKNMLDVQRKQGDMKLAETMRTFLKDNADEVFNSLKDTLENIYGELILGLLRKTFTKVPLKKLFKNV